MEVWNGEDERVALEVVSLLLVPPSPPLHSISKAPGWRTESRTKVHHQLLCNLMCLKYMPSVWCVHSRCWRVLRSWTTACCWASTTRPRQRGSSSPRARLQGAMRRSLRARGPCTPPPWSPYREGPRAETLWTTMTRESYHTRGCIHGQAFTCTQTIHIYVGMHAAHVFIHAHACAHTLHLYTTHSHAPIPT